MELNFDQSELDQFYLDLEHSGYKNYYNNGYKKVRRQDNNVCVSLKNGKEVSICIDPLIEDVGLNKYEEDDCTNTINMHLLFIRLYSNLLNCGFRDFYENEDYLAKLLFVHNNILVIPEIILNTINPKLLFTYIMVRSECSTFRLNGDKVFVDVNNINTILSNWEGFEKVLGKLKERNVKQIHSKDENITIDTIEVIYKEEKKPINTYIMYDNITGLYKIGKSVSIAERERTLCSQMPQIETILYCELNIEKKLHLIYDKKRHRGEWFRLTADDILDIINDFQFKKY